jgi:hypothetical protein
MKNLFNSIELILPSILMIFGILAVILAKNEKNYKKLTESGGNEFALKTTKTMKTWGYLLMVASGLWLIATLLLE